VTGEIAIDSLLETFIVFFFYDGASPPTGVFDEFNAIPFLTDGTQVQSYYDLVSPNFDMKFFFPDQVLDQ